MMKMAFPYAEIDCYRQYISEMTCHSKDRHVLAATVASHAHTVVTFNVKDFLPESVSPWDVEVIHPDEFLLNQLDLFPGAVRLAILEQQRQYRNPPMTLDAILSRLSRCGVPKFVDELGRHEISS